jgi:5,10-methylenetetrahydromethanopterin reductase
VVNDTTATGRSPGADDSAPVIAEDLSAYVISGAVKAEQQGSRYESDARTPAQGIQDIVDAERIGFRAAWLSERWDIKEAGVILSAAGALTSRIELGTGMVCPPTRHPWQMAALAATMQACHGNRFTLGLGRGTDAIWHDMGLRMPTYRELGDYVDMLRTLWRGGTVSYEGSLGRFPALAFSEVVPGPPPVWFGTFAKRRGADLLARHFDGVVLPPVLTPRATAKAVARIREACERVGRDPAEIRVVQSVITAPDLDDAETRSLAHGRAVGYLQYPEYGETLIEENDWDLDVVHRLRGHEQLTEDGKVADRRYHRHELLEPAKLVPDEWMADSCALGSVDECVKSLRRFRDAGADEITTYGSTPAQNRALLQAWLEEGAR